MGAVDLAVEVVVWSTLAGTRRKSERNEKLFSSAFLSFTHLLPVLRLPLSVLLIIALPLLPVLLHHQLLLFRGQVLVSSGHSGNRTCCHLLLLLGRKLPVPGHGVLYSVCANVRKVT